jgi:hypothetical protein
MRELPEKLDTEDNLNKSAELRGIDSNFDEKVINPDQVTLCAICLENDADSVIL